MSVGVETTCSVETMRITRLKGGRETILRHHHATALEALVPQGLMQTRPCPSRTCALQNDSQAPPPARVAVNLPVPGIIRLILNSRVPHPFDPHAIRHSPHSSFLIRLMRHDRRRRRRCAGAPVGV